MFPRTIGPILLAIAFGVGAGELWARHARGPQENPPVLVKLEPAQAYTSRNSPEEEARSNHQQGESSTGEVKPGTPVKAAGQAEPAPVAQQGGGERHPPASRAMASSDEQFPLSGPALITGGSGATLLHGAEYKVGGGLPLPLSALYGAEEQLSQRQKKKLRIREGYLQRAMMLGEPPWERDQFQIVSALDPLVPLAVVGRDFEIPASPEDSVRWFEHWLGAAPSQADREEAIELLRDWEVERRAFLAKLVSRGLALAEMSRFRVSEVVAYGVVGRTLVLIRKGESPEVEEILEAAAALPETIKSEARALLE